MKKISKILAVAAGIVAMGLTACGGKTYEIAVVTDVGSLKDGGFNEGTYNGAVEYGKENKKTVQYYQPANGSDATDNDRENAFRQAIKNGAKIIVTPGFLQEAALETVSAESPETKFVFVDGWNIGKANVTAISYKEQESSYLAGYAVVKDGYTKIGGTFGGGGSNPACNRYAYGYLEGAQAAANELGVTVDLKLSFKYGESFSASTELQTQISSWYKAGTEVVFSCGGSMVDSVLAAANGTTNGKVVGVDVDQASLSTRVITSAVKGLTPSVKKVLGQFYKGEWDSKLADKTSNLGAADDATGLPTAKDSWRFNKFTVAEYEALFAKIKSGSLVPATPSAADCNDTSFWALEDTTHPNVNISFEK